jgi:hypothetical protein
MWMRSAGDRLPFMVADGEAKGWEEATGRWRVECL